MCIHKCMCIQNISASIDYLGTLVERTAYFHVNICVFILQHKIIFFRITTNKLQVSFKIRLKKISGIKNYKLKRSSKIATVKVYGLESSLINAFFPALTEHFALKSRVSLSIQFLCHKIQENDSY